MCFIILEFKEDKNNKQIIINEQQNTRHFQQQQQKIPITYEIICGNDVEKHEQPLQQTYMANRNKQILLQN